MAGTENSSFNRIIRAVCKANGIGYTAFSDSWGYRLTKDGKHAYIVGYQFPLNPASSRDLCQDKVLTYEVLTDAGIAAVPHYFLPMTLQEDPVLYAEEEARIEAFLGREGCLVLKDNYGTGGLKVWRVRDMEGFRKILKRIWTASYAAAWCPFVEIEEEYRAVMLDGEAKLVIRKERDYTLDPSGNKVYATWKHNLGQGATGVPVRSAREKAVLGKIAGETVEALKMRFCSVDIVKSAGEYRVLEVNAGVMMEHFAGQSRSCFEKAKQIYGEAVLRSLS
ncbi:MAG: hypothetical protein J6Z23_05625 [Lachnospiraceae bacterium]|nr:hypothetical protein [Lachnospiraceae bacterium]